MEFKFPDVGEGIIEGKLIKWLVNVGDTVKTDSPIAEVETDKAVVEIPCPVDGVVKELLFKEQDILNVGKVMIIIDEDGKVEEKVEEKLEEKEEIKIEKKEHDISIRALPSVRKFARQKGIDLSSIKGTGKDGIISKEDIENQTGHTVTKPIKTELQKSTKKTSDEFLATPSTRKLARELHVDITSVVGSGDHGIITKEDVRKAVKDFIPKPKEEVTVEHLEGVPKTTFSGNEEIVPMSEIRKTIARRMIESKSKAAHVTHMEEIDVTELSAIRDKEKLTLKDKGVHLTFLPFFMKAAIIALEGHPLMNSEIKDENIILKKYYNIGFATDTERGLIVPVIKNVDKKSIVDIAKEITSLATQAKEGKLSLNNMQNGTFTITSVGNIGGDAFTPIINYPQVGILGIGKIKEKPVVIKGKIVIRKMVTLSLSYDHRVIDGAEGARFVNTLKEHLEDPNLLFLEMI